MSEKYFVIYGHYTESNYNEPPQYEIEAFDTKEEVLKLHAEWLNPENYGDHEYCSECIFKVIKGTELSLKPVEKVVKYELH